MEETKKKGFLARYTPLEKSWIVYDAANSAFTLMVSTLIPIWFNELSAQGGVSDVDYLANWSFGVSIATIIMVFLGPILGSLADHQHYKKRLFIFNLAVGVLGCIAMGLARTWSLYIVLFVISKVTYQSTLVLYDSMLVDVTSDERMDDVSSNGYAMGYLGSCIPFIVALVFYVLGTMGKLDMQLSITIGFVITGVWWFCVTLPLLKNYHQTHYVETKESVMKESFARLGETLVHLVKHDRKVFLFLLAFFFYIDGVYTIIDEAVAIGKAMGLDSVGLLVVLLLTQVVAWFFATWFGKLSEKYNTVTLISICIGGYFAVAIFALFLHSLWQFGIMGFMVGMFQGAVQALSRSYYAKIIPDDKSGEYFGIYDICGKGASFMGTMLIGIVSKATGRIEIGVATMAVLFIIGFILLKVSDRMPDPVRK
ncbi:MAG: MFS transporter [Bulleidia sp.]|nr:MFS transporter [Bulleidia sp.]